jgi:hypothetical protein
MSSPRGSRPRRRERAVGISERVYRSLLRAYPRQLRDDYGDEMGRVFGAIRPAGTMVGNSTLVNPDLRVEIEVDVIVNSAIQTRGAAEEVNLGETES